MPSSDAGNLSVGSVNSGRDTKIAGSGARIDSPEIRIQAHELSPELVQKLLASRVWSLPRSANHFLGRKDEVDALCTLLRQEPLHRERSFQFLDDFAEFLHVEGLVHDLVCAEGAVLRLQFPGKVSREDNDFPLE